MRLKHSGYIMQNNYGIKSLDDLMLELLDNQVTEFVYNDESSMIPNPYKNKIYIEDPGFDHVCEKCGRKLEYAANVLFEHDNRCTRYVCHNCEAVAYYTDDFFNELTIMITEAKEIHEARKQNETI